MRIINWIVCYNGMGGHPVLSFAGDFLLNDFEHSLGDAFDAIEIYSHVPSRLKDSDFLFDRFQAHISGLPKFWVKRKLRRIEISICSELGYAEDLIGESRVAVSTCDFSDSCYETACALELLPKRLKPNELSDYEKLMTHVKHRLALVPKTDEELTATIKQLRTASLKYLTP